MKRLDIEMYEGEVVGVWFGCVLLPFETTICSEERANELVDSYLRENYDEVLMTQIFEERMFKPLPTPDTSSILNAIDPPTLDLLRED